MRQELCVPSFHLRFMRANQTDIFRTYDSYKNCELYMFCPLFLCDTLRSLYNPVGQYSVARRCFSPVIRTWMSTTHESHATVVASHSQGPSFARHAVFFKEPGMTFRKLIILSRFCLDWSVRFKIFSFFQRSTLPHAEP